MKNVANNPSFRIFPNTKVNIKNFPTSLDLDLTEEEYEEELLENVEKIGDEQEKLFASATKSILIVIQAMDAAGKDSTIKNICTGLNPQGVQVVSFKQPSKEELEHDFLWRVKPKTPALGMMTVFNRSHYEEVLVVRVHPNYLLGQSQSGITDVQYANDDFWQKRFETIKDFESELTKKGTKVIKFFLNVSQQEQHNRFRERIENPEKNWKFSYSDLKESALWDSYMHAYEELLTNTSTNDSPWYIIPADDKVTMQFLVSEIVKETIKDMDLNYPEATEEQKATFKQALTELK